MFSPLPLAICLPGTSVDIFVIRPSDILRKMFDELTCALHWMVLCLLEINNYEGLQYTATYKSESSDQEVYSFFKIKQTPFENGKFESYDGSSINNIKKFHEFLGSRECDKLLQHISLKKNQRFYSSDHVAASKQLIWLRNAIFHRNVLADQESNLRIFQEIDKIHSWMKAVVPHKLTSKITNKGYVSFACAIERYI